MRREDTVWEGTTTAVTLAGISMVADGRTGTSITIDRINPFGIVTTATAGTIPGTVTIIPAISVIRTGDTAGQWHDVIGGGITTAVTCTGITGITEISSFQSAAVFISTFSRPLSSY